VKVRRLTSFERFICVRENLVFDSLIYHEYEYTGLAYTKISTVNVNVLAIYGAVIHRLYNDDDTEAPGCYGDRPNAWLSMCPLSRRLD